MCGLTDDPRLYVDCAHALGWHVSIGLMDETGEELTTLYNPNGVSIATDWGELTLDDFIEDLPELSIQHLENAIERHGLQLAYVRALLVQIESQYEEAAPHTWYVDWRDMFFLICATPEQKCRAFLEAMKHLESTDTAAHA